MIKIEDWGSTTQMPSLVRNSTAKAHQSQEKKLNSTFNSFISKTYGSDGFF
jgi:hypothetical protein